MDASLKRTAPAGKAKRRTTGTSRRPSAVEASALKESEDRLTFALEAGQLGYWELDLTTRELVASDRCKACWGRAPHEPLTHRDVLQAIHPDDRRRHAEAGIRAILEGAPFDLEYRIIWPDASVHWLVVRGRAVYNADGKPVRMVGITLDVTERKRTEEALREHARALEILNRTGAALAGNLDVHRIIETVTHAATELTRAQFGAFFYNAVDERGEGYTLYALAGVPREAFAKFPMPRNTAVFEPTFRGTGIVRSDNIRNDPRYGRNPPYNGLPPGHLPVTSYLAVPVVSRSGKVLGGLFFGHELPGMFDNRCEALVVSMAAQAAIAIDNAQLFAAAESELNERRRVEKHQDLLLAELNHRVKNTLAIVLSIATQTLRHAPTASAFQASFEARIIALAEAHNLLTESNWRGASLRDIVDRVLEPFRGSGASRYTITADEPVFVGPKTAVALVMALHELATNAAKHGALSNETGRIAIAWQVAAATSPRLKITWQESGGPPMPPNPRSGFGSRLIRGLSEDASGRVEMQFAPTGLVCVFDLPLPAGI